MQFLTQTILIHLVRNTIAIIRSRVNQNRNKLITKLTVHLNDRFLMVFLFVIQCCINTRNALTNTPNSLCLLHTIYLRPTTLILWIISPAMISSTSMTPHELLILLLHSKSLPPVRCIEIIRWWNILFITLILRSYDAGAWSLKTKSFILFQKSKKKFTSKEVGSFSCQFTKFSR